MRKLKIDEIKNRLVEINPNIEILSDEYINNSTKLKCKCRIDGYEWNVVWGSLYQGTGCPKCYSRKARNDKILSINKVKERLKDINPNIEILSDEYISNKSKLKCKCLIDGHEWSAVWGSLQRGVGCPECSNSRKDYTIDDIREKLYKSNPNIEILSSQYINAKSKLKCKCLIDGYKWDVTWDSLNQGHGCPKCKTSKGEAIVSNILSQKRLIYTEQFKLEECKNERLLPFDFAVFDYNMHLISLVEYDGEQHFKPIKHFGGEKTFKERKQRDEIKNTYCKENNIPLLRIPYWEKDNIENILDEWLEKIDLIKKAS